jgi:hypothetical protein
MKRLASVAVLLASVLGVSSVSSATVSPKTTTFAIPAVEAGVSLDVPSTPVVAKQEARKANGVAKKTGTPELRWVCGEMHDNWTGGRNQDCSWR